MTDSGKEGCTEHLSEHGIAHLQQSTGCQDKVASRNQLKQRIREAKTELPLKSLKFVFRSYLFFLVSSAEERPWRPIQSSNNGRKKKGKAKRRGRERDQIKFIDLSFGRRLRF